MRVLPTLWWMTPLGVDALLAAATIASPPTVIQWIRCSQNASAGATTVRVDALDALIPSGTQLRFSGGTTATLTAVAAAGASSLSVSSLPGPIAEGETATGSVNTVHMRQVLITMPAPTLVEGRPT